MVLRHRQFNSETTKYFLYEPVNYGIRKIIVDPGNVHSLSDGKADVTEMFNFRQVRER